MELSILGKCWNQNGKEGSHSKMEHIVKVLNVALQVLGIRVVVCMHFETAYS